MQAETVAAHILSTLCDSATQIIEAAKAQGRTSLVSDGSELYLAAKHTIPRISMFFEKMASSELALSLFLGLWPRIVEYLQFCGTDPALVEACLKIVTYGPISTSVFKIKLNIF